MKRKKIIQTGIFIILIFVPVFAFLFLYFFGENHYHIPTYYPQQELVDGDTVYHTVPDFEFVNQEGNVVTRKDYENNIVVVDYFFTSCLGPCPKMSEGMQFLQERIKESDAEDVKLLSHTVDPEHDSVEVLKEYGDLYGADPKYWSLVTGNKKDLYRQAREGYYLVATQGDGGEDDFIHSQRFVLIDQNGHIRGYYDGTSRKELERLLKEIEILRYQHSIENDEE